MNLTLLFDASLYSVISFGALLLVGASIYDLRLAAERRRLHNVQSLHTTVLLYAHNNAATITACLQHLASSHFVDYDIVVADVVSDDDTRQCVRTYQRAHPDVPLRLYAMRKVTTRQIVLRQAYRRSQRGEVVLVIDADSLIDAGTAHSLALFSGDDTLQALRFIMPTQRTSQLGSVVQYFVDQSYQQYVKARSLVRRSVIPFGCNGCVYRVSASGKRRVLPTMSTARLGSGLVAVVRGGLDFAEGGRLRLRDWVALMVTAWSLILCVWVVQLAATLQASRPLPVVWLVMSAWLVVIVASDERTHFIRKMGYLMCVPVFGLIIYVYIALRWSVGVIYRAVRIA